MLEAPKMIILWTEWEVFTDKNYLTENFMSETIWEVEHQRASISSYSKTAVKDFNDCAGNAYKNHVKASILALAGAMVDTLS